MRGVHVDLLEVGRVRGEQLDQREADRSVVGEGDPQSAAGLRLLELTLARRLVQHGRRGVAGEQRRRRPLDRGEVGKVLQASTGDRVASNQRHASTAYTSTGALIPLSGTGPTGRRTKPFGPPSAARVLSVTRIEAPRSRVFTCSRAA